VGSERAIRRFSRVWLVASMITGAHQAVRTACGAVSDRAFADTAVWQLPAWPRS
jgi:hypothetical protein